MHYPSSLALGAVALLASHATAQFNDQWVSFVDETATRLPGELYTISNSLYEVDFATGDLDQDGFTDLVVVRKEPFTKAGLRTNMLFMNEAGELRDRTAKYASTSSFLGDKGLLEPTVDRDVQVADFNGDGWLDVVTATSTSDGLPKFIGHPRIYINLGKDAGGNWLGLRYEVARIPQLHSFVTGNPENPRFTEVAVGDVNGDGSLDLYFVDHDSSLAGGVPQPPLKDLNDRLLINDGNGYFTDESQLRMTPMMLDSDFGSSARIGDYNLDGAPDVLKLSANDPTHGFSIAYNDPNNVGTFNQFDRESSGFPYAVNHGDLNNDGRLDILVTDDGADRMHINIGTDGNGSVIFAPVQTYDFIAGSDEGPGGQIIVADLDGDGWTDTLHCPVDIELVDFNRRLHIYHNRTSIPGSPTVLLREERESTFANSWLGAVGMTYDNLQATYDAAVFDIDNDGDLDMVLGRRFGTQLYINGTVPTPCGITTYGTNWGGSNVLTLLATGSLQGGSTLDLVVNGKPQIQVAFAISTSAVYSPELNGTVLVDLNQLVYPLQVVQGSGGQAKLSLTVPTNPSLVGFTAFAQAASVAPQQPFGWALSNGVKLTVCP